MNMCTPERVAHAREVIYRSATEAGRDPSAIASDVFIRSCVDQDEDAALVTIKSAVRPDAPLPPYARQFKAMGLDADSPDALFRAVTLIGPKAAARARLDGYRRAGADLPIVYPIPACEPDASIRQTLLSLAPLYE